MARRTKCTEACVARIVAAVEAGLPGSRAAAAAGISERTYFAWRRRGREREEPYLQFVQSLEKAESSFEMRALQAIERHGAQSWQAMAWLLERRWPARYSLRAEIRSIAPPPEDEPHKVEITFVTANHKDLLT